MGFRFFASLRMTVLAVQNDAVGPQNDGVGGSE